MVVHPSAIIGWWVASNRYATESQEFLSRVRAGTIHLTAVEGLGIRVFIEVAQALEGTGLDYYRATKTVAEILTPVARLIERKALRLEPFDADLLRRTLQVAARFGLQFEDAASVVVAANYNRPFIVADEGLYRSLQTVCSDPLITDVYLRLFRVIWLADFSSQDPLIGQCLMSVAGLGLGQLDEAMRVQAERESDGNPRPLLGELLVDLHYVTSDQVEEARKLQS